MTRPRLTVVMATYNGERFLEEQLASLAMQRRLPDELVVTDDRSTDRTVEIIESYASKVPFPVHLHVNAERLGSTRNFERGISLATGDLIALCDQDDVWHPSNLARKEDALLADERNGASFCNASVVDDQLRPLGYDLWASLRFRWEQASADSAAMQIRRNVVTGANLMFHARFRDEFMPISPAWVHDGWIATLISFHARLQPIPEPLMKYRQHSASQIGAQPPGFGRRLPSDVLTQRLQDAARNYALVLEHVQARPPPRADVVRMLEEKVVHTRSRLTARQAPRFERWRAVAREIATGRYRRYSNGWRSAAVDLAV